MLSILIFSDELHHILAAGAETASGNLLVDIGPECVWQGYIHRAHMSKLAPMAKFGKVDRLRP